jgi:prepilin-type N-terminal cleavage/methylation domain-containing protein
MTPHGSKRPKGRTVPPAFGRAKRHRFAALLAPDAGFTLVEVLVATLVAVLLLGGTASVFITGQVDATSAIARADAVAIANTGLREMDQDLRQAYQVEYPTSTLYNSPAGQGCAAPSAGIQSCNQLDVLARTGSQTDYEVRYDCYVTSATNPPDKSCVRYQCAASAATGSGSTCTSINATSTRVVIDNLVNYVNTPNTPVFSLSYQSSATRPSSGMVTIKVPAAATLSKASHGDPATVVLQDGIFMPNLSFGQ